jgi:hypothetical protein
MDGRSYTSLVLRGYSPWSAGRIMAAIDAGTVIADLPGDFTIVAQGADGGRPLTRIVTSMVGARPYYFARPDRGAGARFAHGTSVFEVARDAGLPWRWNRRAVSCMALFGHTIGQDTLHPDVLRAPPASVITVAGDRCDLDARPDAWRAVFAPRPATEPDKAVGVLVDVFREMAAASSIVSLSAGFDSRLLLALALAAGERPATLTMGFQDSTDLVVASRIARALGLEHRAVELAPSDYLAHALEIVGVTSGSKTMAHWHTDLYVRAAGFPAETVHYVGSNGEFARSFFFDRGAFTLGLARAPIRLFEAFFAAKLARRAMRFPKALFAGGAGPLGCARHAAALVRPLADRFADALDCFYATQRVRHFIGNGLALYARHNVPRSPFLDVRWIRAISALSRSERLGSNYHRRAITALRPDLLDFPVGTGGPMASRAPPFYYLRDGRPVGYSPFGQALATPMLQEMVVESDNLDEILPRTDRIIEMRRQGAGADLLVTLAFAAQLGYEKR